MALAFSLLQDKQYTASADVLLSDQANLKRGQVPQTVDPARRANTAVDLIRNDKVAGEVARSLPGFDRDTVLNAIDVATSATSDLVAIEATASSPRLAAQIANTYSETYVAFRNRLNGVQSGQVKVVDVAELPTSPSSPKPLLNAIIGLVLGVPLGVGLALLLERFDRRVRDETELEALFGAPLLGRVPESSNLASGAGWSDESPSVERDSFQMIRANLRYLHVSREIRSVMLTSVAPGDGKSTVAFNLALAAADVGGRVAVIEADLRNPSLQEMAAVPSGPGLTAVLIGNCSVDEAMVEVKRHGADGRVDLLLAGAVPPNPAELLESARMLEVLHEIEGRYDLVVVDCPPVSIISDGIPLIGQVSSVIVVGRVDRSTRDGLSALSEQLDQLGAPLVGVVANFAAQPDSSYYEYIEAQAVHMREPSETAVGTDPASNGDGAGVGAPEVGGSRLGVRRTTEAD